MFDQYGKEIHKKPSSKWNPDSDETFSNSDLNLDDSDFVQPRSNRVSTESSSEDESRSSTSTPVSVTNTIPRSRSRPTPAKQPRVAGRGSGPQG